MISPAIILSKVTENTIKSKPVIAPVNNSLPFLTCSALSPPVMIWMVAASMMTREMAPAIPARKVRRAAVKPVVEVGIQPRPVKIWGLVSELPGHPTVGSMARVCVGDTKRLAVAEAMAGKYVRMGVWFLSGKNFFIKDYWLRL